MTSAALSAFYEKRTTEFSERVTAIRKKINLVANVRLLSAALILGCLYMSFTESIYLLAAAALVVLFTILVKQHSKLFDERTHLENLVRLNENEHKALTGDSSAFATGAEFIDAQHPYSHDLDIYGEGSLYQALNRCNTWSGQQQFAHRLSYSLPSAAAILETQQAVRELADKSDFRQHFQAAGMEMNEQRDDRKQLQAWLKQPAFVYGNPFLRYALILLPVCTWILIALSFYISPLRGWVVIAALAQWVTLGTFFKRINIFHDYISRKKNILAKYAQLLKLFQQETFQSPLLQKLSAEATEADQKVQTLASLVRALDARLNFLTTAVMNSLFMYDLQYVYRLEKWKEDHAGKLNQWLEVVSEAEVIMSLSTFAFNHPNFQYATIHEKLSINVQALGHPLLQDGERVTNDVAIGHKQDVLIVTGANMAGKSTFLRTLGINLVLALNGAPVCAASFTCPVIQMRTGMRTADSLKDHQSYFFAELNRLKTIMDELRSDKPQLILLDEILKGTNSTDKQAGSIALVKQLLEHPCLAIIATHDLVLGDLENTYPDKVKNYCFEATIENDQLSFDYKLKPGLATKMNATFLMKKMGIIPA